jgi:PAS domain S-box-containing protein
MVGREIKILVVDDQDACWLVDRGRKSAGPQLRFDVAANLREALKYLEINKYDALLIDLGLPESSELQTFHIIHKQFPETPLIILTTIDDEQAAAECIKKGASDYLIKGSISFTDTLTRSVLYAIECKRVEQAVRQSEKDFRNIINESPDAIAVIDANGFALFVNHAAEELLGQTAEELLGKAFCFPMDVGNKTEVKIIKKYGGTAIVEMRMAETDWRGKDAYIVSLRDITMLRSKEKLLERYRKNLKSLTRKRMNELDAEKELLSVTFSSMSEGIIVVDTQKRVIFFNKVAEEMAGWEFELVQDKPIDELICLVNEITMETSESPIDKVLRSGKTYCGTDLNILVGMNGTEHPVSTVTTPLRMIDGQLIGVVMVFRDASRDREIERMKQDLVSSISHELRTPLTSIIAYTETILSDAGMPEKTKYEFLSIIDEEAQRLANLIESLLDISRLESKRVCTQNKLLDMSIIVEQISSTLQPIAKKKNVVLRIDYDDELPQFMGDESKLLSLITNLVNNAIKFTPERGEVCLLVRKYQNELVIRVKDTGIGIPKEALSQIFKPFYRVPSSSKNFQGTGLGLPIVQKIVTMHDGKIKVESKVNQGTTFSVFLPFKTSAEPEVCLAK